MRHLPRKIGGNRRAQRTVYEGGRAWKKDKVDEDGKGKT